MRSTVLSSLLSLSLVALMACGGGEDDSSATSTSASGNYPADTATDAPDGKLPKSAIVGSEDTAPNGDEESDEDPAATPEEGADSGGEAKAGEETDAGAGAPTSPASDDLASAGPKPTQQCQVSKDANGFFVRNSGKSSYVAYVPASYTGDKPMRLLVGLHGCGDNAQNFATWGVNPYDTRKTQTHIGISVDGASGGGSCWSMGGDDAKVLAAVEDISKCFWVHQKKITIGGYSSGGQLAYRVGMKNANKFAGIIIENSGLYAADSNPDALIANAARKLPVAHRAGRNDSVFPIAKVQADWAKLTKAGFPVQSQIIEGGTHNGTNKDWYEFLIPASANWVAP